MGSMGRWGLAGILVFVAASRVPLWTGHPPNFDFANFALGVERFAPQDHQPHPPGYPAVILLARLFAAAGLSTVHALHATGLVGSLLALWGAWVLGQRLAGLRGAVLAALLLAFQPAFWYSGLTSPTRPYLAASVCWLLYCLLRMMDGQPDFLWITAATLALVAGFRPELLLLFATPALLAARLGGVPWRSVAAGAAVCLLGCAPWIVWVVSAFGSPSQMAYVDYHYFLHHTATTSAFFGAPAGAWHSILRAGLVWNGISGVVMAFAVLASRRQCPVDRRFLLVAGAYFLPALFIQLGIHLGADSPDHALGTIALLSVLGGAWLAGTAAGPAIAAGAILGMLSVSLAPAATGAPELNILSVRGFLASQRPVAENLARLRASLRPNDAIVVASDSPLSWRLLRYEFPDSRLIFLESPVRAGAPGPPAGWLIARGLSTPLDPAGINLAGAERLQVFPGPQSLIQERLCAAAVCEAEGWRLQVGVPQPPASVSLPPYTLSF